MSDNYDYMLRFLRSGYGHFSAQRSIGPAQWAHHDLFFVHRGAVILEFPKLQQRLELERGMGVLIWPQTAFAGRPIGQTAVKASIQHFALASSSPAPLRRWADRSGGFSRQTAEPSAWLESCVNRMQRAASSALADGPALQALLLQVVLVEGGFVDTALSAVKPPRIALHQLEKWIRERLATNPTLPAMAEFCGLSSSRFRAVFQKQTGQTAGEFLRQLRDAEAKRLLVETPEPIKAIAAALGYASPAVFHHAFKFRTGETPARFRNRETISG